MGGAEPPVLSAGYLEVAGLDAVSYRELTDRHAWLVDTIAAAGPGTGHPSVLPAALALVAVLTELDTRAGGYRRNADVPYWCSCGYQCTGLAAFDLHLDQYPAEGPGSGAHEEVTGAFAAGHAAGGTERG